MNLGQIVATLQDTTFQTIRRVNCPVIHNKVTRSACVSQTKLTSNNIKATNSSR